MADPGHEPSAGYLLRGRFVKWPEPGYAVEGIVTFVDLEGDCAAATGESQGLVQVYNPSAVDQGAGRHGFYRNIDLGNKALRSQVKRCVESGLQPGWHLRLTFVENVKNQVAGLPPWKRFKTELAEPTLSPAEIEALVSGGQREASRGPQ